MPLDNFWDEESANKQTIEQINEMQKKLCARTDHQAPETN